MGVSVRGLSDLHLHHPCPQCGFASRYKQWPIACACSKAQRQKIRATPDAHVVEIWAQREAKNAELRMRDCTYIPPMRVGARYAAGRPRFGAAGNSTRNEDSN